MTKKKQKKTVTDHKKAEPDRSVMPAESLAGRYRVLIAIGLLIAAICVMYPQLVFQNKIFMAGDVEAAASFATAIDREIDAKGGYPLWNPYLFSGMPSFGSLSYNPYVYPVSVLISFPARLFHLPNATWLLFHVFMLGFGVFLLLADRGVHFLIAAGAAILMMWMPNYVAMGAYGHGSQAIAVAFMPYALLFWDRIWRGKSLVVNASALVIVLGFQFLRAHLQISYYTFAFLALHTVFFGVSRIRGVMGGKTDPEYPATLGFFRRFLRRERVKARRLAVLETTDLVVVFGLVVIGALLMSAVLFLPVDDYSANSIRGSSESGGLEYDYATSWSLHPLESLTFVLPFSFGFGKSMYHGHMPFTDYPNYVGLVVVFFSVFALILARTRFVWFLTTVVIATTLLSFGKFFPLLYDPLFKWLPYFNKFRVPVMVLIVQQLAFVLLFALGLSAVVKDRSERAGKAVLWGTVGAFLILVVVLFTSAYWTGPYARAIAKDIVAVRSAAEQIEFARFSGSSLFKDLVKSSMLLFAVFGLVWLYRSRKIPSGLLVLPVMLIALIDMYVVDLSVLHAERLYPKSFAVGNRLDIIKDNSEREKYLEPDDVIDFLEADAGKGTAGSSDGNGEGRGNEFYRVFPAFHPSAPLRGGDFAANRYMNFGISSVGGYHAAKLSLYNDFLEALEIGLQSANYHLIHMMNARYVITSHPFPDVPFFELLWQGKDFRGRGRHIYKNLQAFPRAFFVDRYQVHEAGDILRMLPALPSGGVELSEMVLLEESPGVEPVSKTGAEAEISDYGFNEIRVDATLPSPAILVLSEVFYPRWRVYIDGKEGKILKANYVLRAVALPQGDHEVVFRYDATPVKRGLIVSVVTFATALLVLVASGIVLLRRRPSWKH